MRGKAKRNSPVLGSLPGTPAWPSIRLIDVISINNLNDSPPIGQLCRPLRR